MEDAKALRAASHEYMRTLHDIKARLEHGEESLLAVIHKEYTIEQRKLLCHDLAPHTGMPDPSGDSGCHAAHAEIPCTALSNKPADLPSGLDPPVDDMEACLGSASTNTPSDLSVHIGRCTGGPEDPVVTQMRDQPGEYVDLDTLLDLAPRSPRSLLENLPPLPGSPSFELIDSPTTLTDLLLDLSSRINPLTDPDFTTDTVPSLRGGYPLSAVIVGTAQRPVLNPGSPSIPIVHASPYSVPGSRPLPGPIVGTALNSVPDTIPYSVPNNYPLHTPGITACA